MRKILAGGALTIDTNPTEIFNYPLPVGASVDFDVKIVARDVNDGSSAMWNKRACVKNVNGTVTLVGGAVDVLPARKETASLTWNVTGAIVGDAISLSATGGLGRDIQWGVCAEALEMYNG